MKKAVVLLSGGLDSATCLAYARAQGFECYTLNFDYGQKYAVESERAQQISVALGAKRHETMSLALGSFSRGSALTDAAIDVPVHDDNNSTIPVTYVPARNTVFLAIALGWAEVLAAQAIFIGVNKVDYSGYPDCRPEYIQSFQHTANLATKCGVEGNPITIETPIINLGKAEIIKLGLRLGVDYALTVSCYQATLSGRACGTCDSCYYRKKGFAEAGVADPTCY